MKNKRVRYSSKEGRRPDVREATAPAASNVPVNCVICGDAAVALKRLANDCVDLIVTSPPYADSRKKP